MDKEQFIKIFSESIKNKTFIKMTLSKYAGAIPDVQNLYIRLVEIKQSLRFSFLWRYKTKDITQNIDIQEAVLVIDAFLGSDFLNADLFTTTAEYTLLFNKKREPKLLQKKIAKIQDVDLQHNRAKNRVFKLNSNAYLNALGITNLQGEILKEGQKKYRQIDKYIEIIDSTLKQHPLPQKPHIVDMGSGKGYLTFALYDHLNNSMQANATITGIELRENLVEFCNDLAKKSQFADLDFIAQDIFDYQPKRIDMLIALHACDIATDIAIAKGIEANAEIIIVAPCCHKQIRKEMNTQSAMNGITKFGIMEERQAELLTDGIRALLMEANGYQVKALEFVSLEHTPKNMMLIGVKKNSNPEALQKINEIKSQFGIKTHYLEALLSNLKLA